MPGLFGRTSTISSLWLPTNIGGMKRWGQSDSLITKDEVDRVSVYGDKTGNLNHYVQSTDANKFVWTANQVDGHPDLIGDEIDDYMGCASLGPILSGDDTPFTIFLIAKTSLAVPYQYLFSLGHATGTGLVWIRTDYAPQYTVLKMDDAANYDAVNGGVPTTAWHYILVTYGADKWNMWVDTVKVMTDATILNGVSTFDEALLNCRKINATYTVFSGLHYAEDGIYDNVISGPDVTLLDSYIAARYPSI